jgi:hypothetical protein
VGASHSLDAALPTEVICLPSNFKKVLDGKAHNGAGVAIDQTGHFYFGLTGRPNAVDLRNRFTYTPPQKSDLLSKGNERIFLGWVTLMVRR